MKIKSRASVVIAVGFVGAIPTVCYEFLGAYSSFKKAKRSIEASYGHKLSWEKTEYGSWQAHNTVGFFSIILQDHALDRRHDLLIKRRLEDALKQDERNPIDDYLASLINPPE
jgi:hypothetical protein